MKVYLAGPIDGCTDEEAKDWRALAKKRLGDDQCLDPMRRDYRGKETEAFVDIVEGDLEDIDDCDVVLAYCWKPGWGTPMEIMYASMNYIPVVAVDPGDNVTSPWVRYHASALYLRLEDALTDLAAGVYG